ncbi:MAG: DUF1761 domain-containing protein [Pyrinomonadaceae bacterium]|nr:DUF1761 domain-containing protein [Pyrinomonadaceae bacterium]
MENVNHIAVFVCAVMSLVIGGLWWSPLLFAKAWQKEAGLSDDDLKKANPAKNFGISFLLAWVISYNLAFFLSDPATDWKWGLTAGLLAGVGWAVTSYLIISLFEMRSFKHMMINAGYLTVYFGLIGLILGAWR